MHFDQSYRPSASQKSTRMSIICGRGIGTGKGRDEGWAKICSMTSSTFIVSLPLPFLVDDDDPARLSLHDSRSRVHFKKPTTGSMLFALLLSINLTHTRLLHKPNYERRFALMSLLLKRCQILKLSLKTQHSYKNKTTFGVNK